MYLMFKPYFQFQLTFLMLWCLLIEAPLQYTLLEVLASIPINQHKKYLCTGIRLQEMSPALKASIPTRSLSHCQELKMPIQQLLTEQAFGQMLFLLTLPHTFPQLSRACMCFQWKVQKKMLPDTSGGSLSLQKVEGLVFSPTLSVRGES